MIPKVIIGIIINLLLVNYSYEAQASNNQKVVNVGVIVDFDSRIGREQRAAMEIAARSFNDNSTNFKLLLNFQDSRREALRAASSAKQMIEDKKAEVIIGMDTWQEAALVGKVGNETQVPVISLAAPSITPPQMQLRWPFLVTMASDASAEIGFIADVACAYRWRKVVVIYEDDDYGDDFGTLSLLNAALQKLGSEIEYRLVLPPYSSLSDPKGFVHNELEKLLDVQSRAFIVLRSSLPMVSHLFREAKNLGLMENDSALIITESITSLLDYVDDSVVPLLKGTLGIKTHYSNSTDSYKDFQNQFQKALEEEDQGNSNPGIYALRAYDSIRIITQAIERTASENSGKILVENILSANFDGLGGKVIFEEGKLSNSPILRILNVIGNEERKLNRRKIMYKELGYWVPESGFVESLDTERDKIGKRSASVCENFSVSVGSVVWPGNLTERNPKGWAMPTNDKKLKIGVPGKTQFRKFVTVDESKKDTNEGYDGLCIKIFRMVLEQLNYDLPFQFYSFDGTYDDLVEAVRDETFDAAVGDITILANRSKGVEFTQPYLGSALSMVIPIKSGESAWIFTKPFTWEVWAVTLGILIYTVFIVWFLEHPTNPEFGGTLKNQIGTALWFTFSSLFFAQRERIHSNITRVAVTIWLSLVFILTASYTANLSSMLTVRHLEPDITIEWLKSTNQKVGCDGDSFIMRYLNDVLNFKPENIYEVPSEYAYVDWFSKKNNITAAFLELPYEEVFLNENCNGYYTTARTYKFAGLGFAFQKGSPIARDFSEAILELSEKGNITTLEKQYLTPKECSQNSITSQTESLSIKSFWGIYLISGATSTICFLIALVRLQKKYHRHNQQASDSDQSVKNKVLGFARYFYKGEATYSPGKASTRPTSIRTKTPNLDEWSSSTWDFVSTSDVPNSSLDTSPPPEIEITMQTS